MDTPHLRPVAFWAASAIVQFGRWSDCVADAVALGLFLKDDKEKRAAARWGAERERHFLLVSAHHLIDATAKARFGVQATGTVARDIPDARDLLEHWHDNMPVFNHHPQHTTPPRRSGQNFLANNPDGNPYDAWNWNNTVGPRLLPEVSGADLEQFVRRVERELIRADATWQRHLPPWSRSPWCLDGDVKQWERWFPNRHVYERLGIPVAPVPDAAEPS